MATFGPRPFRGTDGGSRYPPPFVSVYGASGVGRSIRENCLAVGLAVIVVIVTG